MVVVIFSPAGLKSADEEPVSKKPKMSIPKKPEPVKTKPDPRSSRLPSSEGTYPPQTGNEFSISDSQLPIEDVGASMHVPPAALAPVVTPPVSSVTITRRDPRMAGHRSGVTVTQPLPEVVVPTPMAEPTVPVVPEVKGPLPMPPAPPPSIPRSMSKAAVSRCSKNPVTNSERDNDVTVK